MLYKAIDLPSDEPVQFVGVYVLRWGNEDQPSIAFRQATADEVAKEFLGIFDEHSDGNPVICHCNVCPMFKNLQHE